MPALFFFVTRKTERQKGNESRVCVSADLFYSKCLQFWISKSREKRARQKREKEKKKSEDVCRVKDAKRKKRRYAYALCVGDILFEDDEFVCACVCVRIKML